MLIVSALITGLGLGSMYGLLALGFHVTYAVSATVNFAQGSAMMLGPFGIVAHAPSIRSAARGDKRNNFDMIKSPCS